MLLIFVVCISCRDVDCMVFHSSVSRLRGDTLMAAVLSTPPASGVGGGEVVSDEDGGG